MGSDLPFKEQELIAGNKLLTKLWNASNFTFNNLKDFKYKKPTKLETIDKWLLTKLNKIIKQITESYENYDIASSKKSIEDFFWNTFCDNYLEIIKDRLYNEERKKEKASAQYTLHTSLQTILKLLAPIIPHITEELYQQFAKSTNQEKSKSIHISKWPSQPAADSKSEEIGDLLIETLQKVRQFKTKNNKSLKTPIKLALPNLKQLQPVLEDLKAVTAASTIKEGKFKVEFC